MFALEVKDLEKIIVWRTLRNSNWRQVFGGGDSDWGLQRVCMDWWRDMNFPLCINKTQECFKSGTANVQSRIRSLLLCFILFCLVEIVFRSSDNITAV